MENQETTTATHGSPDDNIWAEHEQSRKRGKIFGGIILMCAGILWVLRIRGYEIPDWVFTWQMGMIVLGLFIGVKHAFKKWGWIVVTGIGAAWMFIPNHVASIYFWPIFLIAMGVVFIFKPHRRHPWGGGRHRHFHRHHHIRNEWKQKMNNERCDNISNINTTTQDFSDDYIQADTFWGNVKKNILSKNFKGGQINCVMSGAEINLTQAEINGRVELQIECVMAGVKLVVPPHWQIQTELTTVMGDIDDKRPVFNNPVIDNKNLLVLKGSVVMGSIELVSY